MSDNSGASSGGIGFVGVLTVALIVLKLVGVISWSWLWVISPIWITASVVFLIIGTTTFLAFMFARKNKGKNNA